MKTAFELFDIIAVPDGFVFKFNGTDDELMDLCFSPGFDVSFAKQKIHTIKHTVRRWKSQSIFENDSYGWSMDGWLSWGNSVTCASDSAWANRNALLDMIEKKFGVDYEKVRLPKAA